MERRKFVIGMGALATGSAAAVGTGAFNFARVDRDVDVSVADDSSAFLGLESTSDYAEEREGDLVLAFDGSIDGQKGDGINSGAGFRFDDVFKIINNSTNDHTIVLQDSPGESVGWNNEDFQIIHPEGTAPETNSFRLDSGTSADIGILMLGVTEESAPDTIGFTADDI